MNQLAQSTKNPFPFCNPKKTDIRRTGEQIYSQFTGPLGRSKNEFFPWCRHEKSIK